MKNHGRGTIVRVITALLIVAVWFGLSGVGGPYFGKIDEVSSNDLSTFLPSSAESTKVNAQLQKFQDSKTIPVIVVFESKNILTDSEQTRIQNAIDALEKTGEVKGNVSPPIISDDKKASFVLAPIDSNSEFTEVIPTLQTAVADTQPGLTYKFTGPAMFAQDLNKAFAGIDGLLLLVALAVVFVILLVVYRSPLLPIITLLGAIFALSAAILIVWHLADNGIVQLNGQVQGILFILVIGAATDYALLYIARYREELMEHPDKWLATKAAWKASWEPIVAAGGTVTLGLLCLLASDLDSNKALGPVGGIGIALGVLSALTFLPATLYLLGRKAFWPRQPQYVTAKARKSYHEHQPAWARVGAFVSRHPRRIWVGFTALLIVACLFVPSLKADGVAQSDFVLGKSEAREGQALLDRHFPSGSGSPVYVLTPESEQSSVTTLLDNDKSIDGVSAVTTDKDKSPAPLGKSAIELKKKIEDTIASEQAKTLQDLKDSLGTQMAGAPQFAVDEAFEQAKAAIPSPAELAEKAYPFNDAQLKVADGKVLLQATLKDSASSLAARATVERLRDTIHASHPSVQIGGVSAVQLDTNVASERDLRVIIPLILFAITAVLMVLLRSIVAPIVLLLTTVLSFGATLGVAALLFNNVWHYPGADPSVLIFGFVFLVALGIDYNIFLMTRVREETKKLGVRAGTIKALVVTGGVISSAGIVLASTFAALYVIPILFLAQIAFIVAFGVLLDTIIVRSLIVPSLTLEVGRFMWWPSKLSRKEKSLQKK